ncbi:MAG: molybdopterin-binding/glycosyltransferase family 2 protein [Alphaproteobacteria bacterium]|nr:molybdopterin-binding/glycosyltransferase family 2 protein [Alphaproteobacteria bacterium]
MQFGSISVGDAVGSLVAHSVRTPERIFKKGHLLTDADISLLRTAGIEKIVVARLDAGDVPEDEAAARLAARLAGENVRIGAAFTGRANLFAAADGLVSINAECIDAVNSIDESLTLATLPPFARVSPRQMIATVKVIPFAVDAIVLEKIEEVLQKPALQVAAFRPRNVAVVLTTLPGTRPALLEKTRSAIRARVKSIGSKLVSERETAHDRQALSGALREVPSAADLVLVFGVSAIQDRGDVVPAAIENTGGRVERFGMPVDPGNLLLIGKIGAADVIGLPGCARSPKLNGFDFVLWRLAAGFNVTSKDISRMGVGGLLMEIPTRPQPRDEPAVARAPKIGGIVLGAGASSRMGANKLLVEIEGKPMIRRVVEAVQASSAHPVAVVTGNDAQHVRSALAGHAVQFVYNPDFAHGLSSSLKCGLRSLPDDCDGAVIVLGDMPDVSTSLIEKLIAAFDPAAGRAICVATRGGKRGNPVLFARRFFEEIEAIEGDVGARGLIGSYPELVHEVDAGSEAPLIDIDTPEDLAAYRKAHP